MAGRIERERATLKAMLALYCGARHGQAPCPECRKLRVYAAERVDRCPFGPAKPTCRKCPVHCFEPLMRARIREVMRFSGPRMAARHPLLALLHFIDGLRPGPPAVPGRRRE